MTVEQQYIGPYRIERLLGYGSMGEVYLVENMPTGRYEVLKLLPSSNTISEREQLLFTQQARLIQELSHPHLLPLLDYGMAPAGSGTLPYVVIPYHAGGSLLTWLQQRPSSAGRLSAQEVAHILRQAGSALQYAHDHGVLHLNLKAEQMFIQKQPDQAYGQYTSAFPDILLSDVGLVQLVQTTSGPASANRYMDANPTTIAPEQWQGHAFPASDQYALSATAYQLLTGYPPFQGNTEQIRYDHLYTQPMAPSVRNPSLPPTLDPVILRALAKQPEARFPNILAFADAFEQALQPAPPPLETGARAGNITITNAPAYAPPPPRRSGMSTITAILLGVLALFLIAGIVGLLARNSNAHNTAQLNATSTAQSANQEATATAQAQNAGATAQAKATANGQSQAQANATATANAQSEKQANATATANAQSEKQANATATANAQANATATVLPATQLSGNWRNTDSNTQGLTRLIISNNGLTMSVQAFAKCTTSPSGECNWGTRQGTFNGYPFVISFTHDNQTDQLTMTMLGNSELQVVDVGSVSGTYVFSKR